MSRYIGFSGFWHTIANAGIQLVGLAVHICLQRYVGSSGSKGKVHLCGMM